MSRNYEVKTFTYSGQGAVLLAERDSNGKPTGFTPIGNVSALTLSLDVSYNSMKEGYSGQRGTLKEVKSETGLGLAMTAQSFDQSTLSLALYGTDSLIAGGSESGEQVVAYLGKTVATSRVGLSNVVVSETTGTTPYDVDVDYTVNEEFGSINIIAGGSITDLESLHVAYDYAEQTHIEGLTASTPERWLRFEGLNTSEGDKPVVIDVFLVNVQPLEELALINDEFGEMAINMTALVDTKITGGGSQFFKQKYITG
jgi:hypothetical protein